MGATELQRRPAESRDCFKSFWLIARPLRLKVGGVKLEIQCHCSPSNDSFFCVIFIKTTSLTHFRKLHAFIKLDYNQESDTRTQKAYGLRSALAYSDFGSMMKPETIKQCLHNQRLIVDSILPRGFILWLIWCPQHESITESSASFLLILLPLVSFLFSYTSLLTNTLLGQTCNFIFTRLLFCKDAYVTEDICCLWEKMQNFSTSLD